MILYTGWGLQKKENISLVDFSRPSGDKAYGVGNKVILCDAFIIYSLIRTTKIGNSFELTFIMSCNDWVLNKKPSSVTHFQHLPTNSFIYVFKFAPYLNFCSVS